VNIVLLEPEIPANTGNIGRTCALTGTKLHLIKPLGFSVDEKEIKRAGLDYWQSLDLRVYENFGEFCSRNPGNIFYATTKAARVYTELRYQPDDYIVFGKESAGIPEEILERHPGACARIPMLAGFRSLNLASSVAVILYEALRQNGFTGLTLEGKFAEK